MATAQTPVVLMPSQGAAAIAVGRSATLAASAAGGHRASTQVRAHGTGTCTTASTRWPGTTAARRAALAFAV